MALRTWKDMLVLLIESDWMIKYHDVANFGAWTNMGRFYRETIFGTFLIYLINIIKGKE